MRLRNITGCREMIGESEFVVHEPETMKGKVERSVWQRPSGLCGNRHGQGTLPDGYGAPLSGNQLYRYRKIFQRAAARSSEAGGGRAAQRSPDPHGCRRSGKCFRAGRAGSHLPEFFRSVAEGPSRKATPGVQTVSGKIRSNPEKKTERSSLRRTTAPCLILHWKRWKQQDGP